MTERLLQYIWQFQYFNHKNLQTESGESVHVIHPGSWNVHQGPDFLQATIDIDGTTWVGNVELHIQTGDWFRHAHQNDKNYNSVILHVVWQNNESNKSTLPLLVLEDKVPKMLLRQYEEWMNNQLFIPCEQSISSVNEITWTNWKDRVMLERLQRKCSIIEKYLKESNQHWEEIFWWLLARNFGVKVNASAFESIARSLPISLLVRHKNEIHQLEALLLGQAGLLDTNYKEKYPRMLYQEYQYYKNKYKLHQVQESIHFLRMRPENFPTLRLAQLAILINQSSHLFSTIMELDSCKQVRKLLDVTANDYWHYHYRPDELSTFKPKKLGKQMIDNIITNTIIPVVFAYGHLQGKPTYKEKSLRWLSETKAEINTITQKFANLGVKSKTAIDSQSILELREVYCEKKRCLDCAVGNWLLKRTS